MSTNCSNRPCGCADSAREMAPPCNTAGDCSGERCSELFCAECVMYCGENFTADTGGKLPFRVVQGERFSTILQRLLNVIINNVDGLYSPVVTIISITATTVTLEYSATIGSKYEIYWTGGSSGLITATAETMTYTIINLTADTAYDIFVRNGTHIANSVIFNINTLTA